VFQSRGRDFGFFRARHVPQRVIEISETMTGSPKTQRCRKSQHRGHGSFPLLRPFLGKELVLQRHPDGASELSNQNRRERNRYRCWLG